MPVDIRSVALELGDRDAMPALNSAALELGSPDQPQVGGALFVIELDPDLAPPLADLPTKAFDRNPHSHWKDG